MSRPIFRSNGSPSVAAAVNIDFNTDVPIASLTYTPSTYAKWDSALWDEALWGGGLSVFQNWQGVNGVGYYGAPVVQTAANGIEVRWVSTDLVIEPGAIL